MIGSFPTCPIPEVARLVLDLQLPAGLLRPVVVPLGGRFRAVFADQGVQLAPAALRQLRKLPPEARRRIQAAVELLAESPRLPVAKKLSGRSSDWCVRTGDYRVIYEICDAQLIVLVVALGHRRDIYQHSRQGIRTRRRRLMAVDVDENLLFMRTLPCDRGC